MQAADEGERRLVLELRLDAGTARHIENVGLLHFRIIAPRGHAAGAEIVGDDGFRLGDEFDFGVRQPAEDGIAADGIEHGEAIKEEHGDAHRVYLRLGGG